MPWGHIPKASRISKRRRRHHFDEFMSRLNRRNNPSRGLLLDRNQTDFLVAWRRGVSIRTKIVPLVRVEVLRLGLNQVEDMQDIRH